ncbi:MAG: 2-succinyl-6-hydroxy-2,4-cyclohexadiene-carboxylate synthase [Solirubrobacteraceae bacterium]|jgi:2-succinyl-6-hydroxy-2,4-cyclohexadiene-1-carboxylate synthase|nr:2-succinyl-6-hydroxy-2,4-cyclohexadiene-carboxylate synthase [Solirubrobacteraceae bacterium]
MSGDLVLLHGFTQTGRSWARVREALGERYRCFAPDLPGHGDADGRRPATFDAVAAYVGALKPDRFALCGYSMGGRLALECALRMPARVQRLVLVGASPGIADDAERARRKRADDALADRIEAEGLDAFVAEWGAQPLFAGQPRGIAELAREDRLRSTAPGLAAALRGMGTGVMTPLWDRLGELAMPVTLVTGEHDEKFRATAERMAAAIPDARLVVATGAGHAVHLEAPEAIAEAL